MATPRPIAPASPHTSFGKKLTLSLGFILASITYAFWQNSGDTRSVAQNSQNKTPALATAPVTGQIVSVTTAPTPVQTTQAAPMPTMPMTPKPMGQYKDGSYTGSTADAYYGIVQVQAIVKNGRLADVQFLQHPDNRDTSRYINGQAMPMLTQEAIMAQSARVDGVSGATETSQAFIESLGSALALAKN